MNLENLNVRELSAKEAKSLNGGGERWSEAIGKFFGYWLSAYAQEEALGAFKL